MTDKIQIYAAAQGLYSFGKSGRIKNEGGAWYAYDANNADYRVRVNPHWDNLSTILSLNFKGAL